MKRRTQILLLAILVALSMPSVLVVLNALPDFSISGNVDFDIARGIKSFAITTFPWTLFIVWAIFAPVKLSSKNLSRLLLAINLLGPILLILFDVSVFATILLFVPFYALTVAMKIASTMNAREWQKGDVAFWFSTFILTLFAENFAEAILIIAAMWLAMSADYYLINNKKKSFLKVAILVALFLVSLAWS